MQTQKEVSESLMELQKQRSSIIKMINAQKSQIISFICRAVGYNSFQDEKERKKLWGTGEKIYKNIIEEKDPPKGYENISLIVLVPVLNVSISIKGLTKHKIRIQENMTILVESLNVCDWWVAERGRSYLGLAVIIGETGDLSGYANPAKVWKRMGVAVINGVAQGRLPKGSSAEEWIDHGFCPRRRASLWTIGDSLIKANGKDGQYKKIYNERKVYETERLTKQAEKNKKKFSPMHAHRRSQKYMEKRLLKDLWNQWNQN